MMVLIFLGKVVSPHDCKRRVTARQHLHGNVHTAPRTALQHVVCDGLVIPAHRFQIAGSIPFEVHRRKVEGEGSGRLCTASPSQIVHPIYDFTMFDCQNKTANIIKEQKADLWSSQNFP